MLKFLNKLFTSQNATDTSAMPNKALCSLSFIVNAEGNLHIVCDWPEFNLKNAKTIQPIAQLYAKTIHSINNGLLESDILNTLKNHDKTNELNSLFVHNTLIELFNLEKIFYASQNYADRPVVSPLNVFK